MLLANAQVSPNIACASTGKATKGWATINARQFLESEPRINILTIRALAALQKARIEKWWPLIKEFGIKAE